MLIGLIIIFQRLWAMVVTLCFGKILEWVGWHCVRDLIGCVKLSLDKNVIMNTMNNDGIGVGGLSGVGGEVSIGRWSFRMYFFGRKIFWQDNIFEKWSCEMLLMIINLLKVFIKCCLMVSLTSDPQTNTSFETSWFHWKYLHFLGDY